MPMCGYALTLSWRARYQGRSPRPREGTRPRLVSAGELPLCDLPKAFAADLASCGHRNGLYEHDVPRDFVPSQVAADEALDGLLIEHGLSSVRDDEDAQPHAELVVGHRQAGHFGDSWHGCDEVLNL